MKLNRAYCFYYDRLNEAERGVYDSMLETFKGYKPQCPVGRVDFDCIAKVYEQLLLDHPEIFYVKWYTAYNDPDTGMSTVRPEYRFTREEVEQIYGRIEKTTEDILNRCRGLRDIEKEKLIHDYIVDHVEYDDNGISFVYEMAGVFLYGRGVCEGMSKAFKYLCDRVGIMSGVAVGQLKGYTEGHAWNVICINGIWYMLDVTHDYSLSRQAGEIRYDYYNVAEGELTDRKSIYPVPECSISYGFYKRQGRYAYEPPDLKRIFREKANLPISLQIRRNIMADEQIMEALVMVFRETGKGWRYGSCAIVPNYDMGVYTIRESNDLNRR